MPYGDTKQQSDTNATLLAEAEDVLGVGAWAWDVARDDVMYSSGLYHLLGRSCASLGHTFASVLALFDEPARGELASTVCQAVDAGRGGYAIELPVNHPVRGRIFVEARGYIERDARGSATRVIGTLLDISERKRAEQLLAQEQRFLDAVIENIPDMIFIKNARTLRFERFNRAGEELLGHTRAELIGKNDFDFFPREQAEFFTGRDRDVLAGTSVVDVPEEPILTRLKGTRILHTKKVPLFDENGLPSHLLGISEDVTDKKRVEAFRLSDLLVRSLEEYAVFLLDGSGRVRTWNVGAERVTGYGESEIVGAPLSRLWDAGLAAALAQAARDGNVTIEVTWRRKDGCVIWTIVTLSAVYSERTVPEHFGVVARDVTTRRKAEEEREALLAQAQEALRLRDEFLSVASHELRTPVATLKLQAGLFTQLLRRSSHELSELLPSLVTKLGHQCDRLERMVDALLDVSRLSAGRMQLSREDVDLCAIAAQVVSRARDEVRDVQTVAVSCPDTEVRGNWDALRLDQILTNLVSNAVKYGSGQPIAVCVEARPDSALISVTDHGIGISPEDRARIFLPFERAVSERHFGGFGLGLYITERLVAAHGGRISVDSTPGDGSTFSVELPYGTGDLGRR